MSVLKFLLLLVWKVLQDLNINPMVVCIPFQYIAALIVSLRHVCPGCCKYWWYHIAACIWSGLAITSRPSLQTQVVFSMSLISNLLSSTALRLKRCFWAALACWVLGNFCCCQKVNFILFAAIFKHFVHCNTESLRVSIAFHCSFASGARKFPSLCTLLLCGHTKCWVGVLMVGLSFGLWSSQETVSATVLWIPLIYNISGAYSTKINLHWYTLLEVKPRVSLVRFLWSAKTVIDFSHCIPLNSFSVLTMARSSILGPLYFCWILEIFMLKNVIGLLSSIIMSPHCNAEVSMYILKGFETSG